MAEPWTTEKIREAFIYDGGEAEWHDPISGAQTQRRIAGDIFDDWLAAHDAEKRAEWEAEQGEVESADQARAHALHDAFWAVHVGRFGARNGTHTMDTFYAGTNAAKRAIEKLHGSPIIRPWVPVNENGESDA